ncbi:MAG TPA: DUF2889 domain-containing protein [Acetobacteraceae bacterium]|jgi:Protein of unknown function (DUF2889)|nr:DUF2889 domain-containing protein [Acetobacteraceae bacterium]
MKEKAMPLSPAAPCKPVHMREVVSSGYRRPDGLWDIEARMTDRKGYVVQNDYRRVAGGGLFHDMSIRVTIDDALLIRGVEACIDAAPHRICPSIAPNYRGLVGLRIEEGFGRELRQRLGGVQGCTHLNELFTQLATTAIQTVRPLQGAPEPVQLPPIDTCHALAATGDVVARYWPRMHRSPNEPALAAP